MGFVFAEVPADRGKEGRPESSRCSAPVSHQENTSAVRIPAHYFLLVKWSLSSQAGFLNVL